MWLPLSKLLEAIGRIRPPIGPSRTMVSIGRAGAPDALDSTRWQLFSRAEALYDVWGPVPGSRWTPYHGVPLFAALQTLRAGSFGPTDPQTARTLETGPLLEPAARLEPLGQGWAAERAWVLLDLPGPQSVALAVRFIAAGFQPVCTFDHWPHPLGLLKPEIILAQLLRYAGAVDRLRTVLAPDAPPLWLCDRDRLGTRRARPREFDNRYFQDDCSLPSGEVLKAAGIRHLICVVPSPQHLPCDDLRAYFRDLRREGIQHIDGAALSDPALTLFEFPEAAFRVKFTGRGYQRSSAGGFGQLIPEPSSGGG